MSRKRISRNDPCPCGSGRKYKKCCHNSDRKITQLDRAMAIEVLDKYVESCDERWEASDVFYRDLDLDVPTMADHFRETSESAFLFWFAFDYQLDDGSYVVDRVLKANPLLASGERRYLEQMRSTAMMPYEVTAVRPGASVVLRRLGTQKEIEVREKLGSQTLKRWDMVLARLNPLGPSGGPEIEMGLMPIPPMVREEIAEVVSQDLDNRPDANNGERRFKDLGAIFHQIWLGTIVAPRIPTPMTAEGDRVVCVTMRFDVLDAERARAAFRAEPSLECEGDTWYWVADGSRLGTIQLAGSQLTFETQSEPRADRGRQLIETAAQDAIAYRDCDRVDLKEEVEKAIRSGKRPEAPPGAEDEIPPEIKDQLFQEFMAKHSQDWLDDHIPALDQQTPRSAALSPALRPRLVELLKEIENHYLRALADGEPGFDPTWMWDELGLSDHQDAPRLRHPVWLAHESMEQQLPGITAVVRSVAERRCAEAADPAPVAVTQEELRAEAAVQELIRNSAGRLKSDALLAHLGFYCSYEIGRRKTFWVDESLAWMLGNTQVDAESRLFRLPFSSYVLVYTDRHTLGVAERALACAGNCPLRGQMLAVLCAYVVELVPGSLRFQVGITFDAFAGQPPHLMSWELHVDPNGTLEETVAGALARAQTPAAGLFRPLLDAVVNATLYTTSAGVKIEQYRVDRSQQSNGREPQVCLPTDSVYHLPGKINISHMRKLQQVARGPGGRTLMHRFMVRGHWRRPGPNWKDQSLRWIEPYWRGPSLAGIIEREYRVFP
jgi:hypothetical protein